MDTERITRLTRACMKMIFDQYHHLAWYLYGSAAVVYTGLVFRGELPRKGAMIFSEHNARTPSAILTIHASFLMVVLLSIRAARSIYPALPDWLTATIRDRGAPTSAFEVILIVAVVGVHFLERKLLYVAAKNEDEQQ